MSKRLDPEYLKRVRESIRIGENHGTYHLSLITEIDALEEQADGYRKALEQIRDYESPSHEWVSGIQRIAREALSDAATAQPKSLYDIPPGCICMGDGLMGMECQAKEHAKLKRAPVPEAGELLKCCTVHCDERGHAAEGFDFFTCDFHLGELYGRIETLKENGSARETIRQLTHKFAEAENTIGELRLVSGEQVETIRQRDERIKSLEEVLRPFTRELVHDESCYITHPKYKDCDCHVRWFKEDYDNAKRVYESTAPPAVCPTCEGLRSIYIESAGETVPCPTCTEAK